MFLPVRRLRGIAASLAALIFVQQSALAHVPQTRFWDARRARVGGAQKTAHDLLPGLTAPVVGAASARWKGELPAIFPPLSSRHLVVREAHVGRGKGPLSGRAVILLQDIHLNIEAQRNIAAALQELLAENRVGLVALEGAFGRLDLAGFRRFDDRAMHRRTAEAFLRDGLMGAPSFVGLTTEAAIPFVGVDDEPLYQANVDAYRVASQARPALRDDMARREVSLAARKKAVFDPRLAAAEDLVAGYEEGRLGLGAYLEKLFENGALADAEPENREVLTLFREAHRMETRMDFARVQEERRAAFERLAGRLSPAQGEDLLRLTLAYRTGEVGFASYYSRLEALLARHGVDMASFPAFRGYLRYVALADGLNAGALFRAVQQESERWLAGLATDKRAAALLAEGRLLRLQKKLSDFALTPGEWDTYRTAADAAESPRKGWAPFERFYAEADARSHAMVERLEKTVRGPPAGATVLVLGGFHTPEIARLLRDRGASYVVASPRLTRAVPGTGSSYLSTFDREKTPLEKLFAGEKLFVYPADRHISAPGRLSAAANTRFLVSRAMAAKVALGEADADGGFTVAGPEGRSYRAVAAGGSAPRGWRTVDGARVDIDGVSFTFIEKAASGTRIGAFFSFLRGVWTDGWEALVARRWLSREAAAQLSFAEEVVFDLLLLAFVPWLLVNGVGLDPALVAALKPVFLAVSVGLFAQRHSTLYFWRDGRVEAVNAAAAQRFRVMLLVGVAIRFWYLVPGLSGFDVAGLVFISHFLLSAVLARFLPWLPIAMIGRRDTEWWRDPAKAYAATTLPVYTLRAPAGQPDPGIGKFTHMASTYRDTLKPQGVTVMALLPHYAILDESPYAPVSMWAVNEDNIDWMAFLARHPELRERADVAAAVRRYEAAAAPGDEVDYVAVRQRERDLSDVVMTAFQAHYGPDSDSAEWLLNFASTNQHWLHDYADFMAIHTITGKPSYEWTPVSERVARADPRYKALYERHVFCQWVGYVQFREAIEAIHADGGRVLFDLPFFRSKNSVDVWRRGHYFRGVQEKRSPGIAGQEWGDLALWDWDKVREAGFDPITDPIKHWLDYVGMDGARNDAIHMAYPIGQLNQAPNEPGDVYANRVIGVFRDRGALAMAEAFENLGDHISSKGFVSIDGNWKRLSVHDDDQRWYWRKTVNFVKGFIRALFEPIGRHASRFIGFTLGDLTGETRVVKTMQGGKSLWRFRISTKPPFDLGNFVRLRLAMHTSEARRATWSPWADLPGLRGAFHAISRAFINHSAATGHTEIWAASESPDFHGGIPWFQEQWGRDTFIALPGLLLTTGRFEQAKDVIRSFAKHERNGLLPNRIPDSAHPDWTEYNTVDAPMFFIQAVQAYWERAQRDDREKAVADAFVAEMMPTIRSIISNYRSGTGYDTHKHISDNPAENVHRIGMDPQDGLVFGPPQATWMDGAPGGRAPVTPRRGKAVEINALWYANLRFLSQLERKAGHARAGDDLAGLADRVRESFNRRFWNPETNALNDVVDGNAWEAALVRPNMLLAVSVGCRFDDPAQQLLPADRQQAVFAAAARHLFTHYGVRTLKPGTHFGFDGNSSQAREHGGGYIGQYHTEWEPQDKDFAYHNGTAWPWLLGPYIDALVRVRRSQGVDEERIRAEVRSALEPIVTALVRDGSIHEVYDGSPRAHGYQIPGGAPSQAWSVSEVFRVLDDYGVFDNAPAGAEAVPAAPAAGGTWVQQNTPELDGKTIVEVTMEMAMSGEGLQKIAEQMLAARMPDDEIRQILSGMGVAEPSVEEAIREGRRRAAMSTSTGGIGPLLKERLIAQNDLGANVIGVSLLYDKVWVQKISRGTGPGGRDEMRQEKVDAGKYIRRVLEPAGEIEIDFPNPNPDANASQPFVRVPVKVWKSPPGMYGKGVSYFLDCPQITDVVYPGNTDYLAPGVAEQIRLAQNFVVGRGALALMEKLNVSPDIVTMSEMPTVFAHHRLIQDRFENDPRFADTKYVFNDHTPLEYAHPHWTEGLLRRLRVNPDYYKKLPPVWDAASGKVDGTAMIINLADAVFGVAEKHGRVMRDMPALNPFAPKIESVTNGVSGAYWPADEFKDPAAAVAMSDDDLLDVKAARREKLLRFIARRQGLGDDWLNRMLKGGNPVGIWTRRIVGYKRADLLADIVSDPEMREQFIKSGIVFILGGRTHQDDPFGPRQYARIQEAIAADPRLREQLIFFENYNIDEAPELFQGADFSVMLANDGREASATGFQKAQMNGALIIASDDGAVPESVHFLNRDGDLTRANGYEVPYEWGTWDNKPERVPTARGFMNAMQLFRRTYDNKPELAKMVRNAIRMSPRVDVRRTAQDQLKLFQRVIQRRERERSTVQSGRHVGDRVLSRLRASPAVAAGILERLSVTPAFSFQYLPWGASKGHEILATERGLRNFIKGLTVLSQMGTVGQWSTSFHLHNHDGIGDFLGYIVEALKSAPELNELALHVGDILLEVRQQFDVADKARLTAVAVAAVDRVLAGLEVTRSTVDTRPGALGLWRGRGLDVGRIGLIEGAAIYFFSAIIMILWLMAMPDMGLSLAVQAALAATVSSLVTGAALFGAHRVFGVLVSPSAPPARDARSVRLATLTAASSLLGTPFLAVSFVWGGPLAVVFAIAGLVVASGLHARLNRRAENLALAAELAHHIRSARAAQAAGHSAIFAAHLDALAGLETWGLARLSENRPTAGDTAWLSKAVVENPAAVADWVYARRRAAAGDAGIRAAKVARVERGEHLGVVLSGRTKAEAMAEIRSALQLLEDPRGGATFVVSDAQAAFLGELQAAHAGRNVRFVGMAALGSAAGVEENLLRPALRAAARFKLMVPRAAAMPAELIEALSALQLRDEYRDAVRVVLVEAIIEGARAVEARLADLGRMLEFRQLVLSQA